MCVLKIYRSFTLILEVCVRQGNSFNSVYSPSIDVTFSKLMSTQTVTSAFQETGELKILAVENWKNNYNYLSQTQINHHIKYLPHNSVNINSILKFMSI
jgi:hypothetical protein